MAITKRADQSPSPQVYSGLILIVDQRVAVSPPGIPHSQPLEQGNSSNVVLDWNENAVRGDLVARYGAGAYGVDYGLVVSAGTGLQASVTAGHAMLDGVVEFAAQSVVLSASQTNWIWAKTNGSLEVKTDLTIPTGACTLIGAAITNGSGVTSTETSGVVYIKNGFPERTTADVGMPVDTPNAAWRGFTKTTDGLYWWNGTAYVGLIPTRAAVNYASDANKTLTVAEASNESIEFTGTLGAGRNAVVPVTYRRFTIYNNTTGGFAVTVKTPSGTGIAVASTKRAILECDGTNVVRVTADL